MELIIIGIGLMIVGYYDTYTNKVKQINHFALNRAVKIIGITSIIIGIVELL